MKPYVASIVVVLVVSVCASSACAKVFADYRSDFKASAPLTGGWQYLWNAPDGFNTPSQDVTTGAIGDPANYIALLDAGTNWTGDGDTIGNNHYPDGYVRLHSTGGHPGAGSATALDRYAIAAYTIQPGDLPGDSGAVFLSDTYAEKPSASGNTGIEVLVHVNDGPSKSTLIPNASAGTFDGYVGSLSVGDTVYVALGPDNHSSSDSFWLDFSLSNLVVADYRDDFRSDAPLTAGWQYLWNAPDAWPNQANNTTGPIGDVDNYLSLVDAGSIWTADGDTNGGDPGPDGYIRLSSTGGHPGRPSVGVDRFAITAFAVSESAHYAIDESFVTVSNPSSNGVSIVVHVNDDPAIFSMVAEGGQTDGFDLYLGRLDAGDTIYVACGTNMSSSYDSFTWDYTIVRVPEPATMLLLGPAALALARRRRRN